MRLMIDLLSLKITTEKETFMDFKVGDTVVLKSGGPRMTIKSKQNSGDWWCVWFNNNNGSWELKGSDFKPETLEKTQ